MKNILKFITKVIMEVKNDNVLSIANELTYKLLLALFPFIIFLMSFLGFLELDGSIIMEQAANILPTDAMNLLLVFVEEVIEVKSPKIMSSSFIIAMISASSGFVSVIRGINKAYGYTDRRGFIKIRLISIVLVLAFVATIAISIILLIFGDSVKGIFLNYDVKGDVVDFLFSFTSYIGAIAILILLTMIIYKLACCKKVSFLSVLPGAFIAVIFWVLASKVFNIYITNFSRYSTVYGSIGSVFILMLWLNIISFFLLVGGEINGIMGVKKED